MDTPPQIPAPAEPPARPRPGQFTAMISGTALDLPEHRALVHQACLEAEVFPVGMEQLPARDATGVEASFEMVDKADVYIGVYASRHGWVPEGSEVSITEMEFDRAVRRKAEGKLREILVFTAHRKHAFTADDIEAGEVAQDRLRKFKERAAEGRVRKEFRSAEELHRLVLQALNEFKSRQQRVAEAASGARPAQTSIPNNLPRLQPFFGREEELAQIREALDPENRTWGALIDGPGSMGKTSLRGQSAEVLACADRAEAHRREAQAGIRERAVALDLRGIGHELNGDCSAAIAAYREAMELDSALDPESIDVAIDLSNLADVEQLSGKFDDAERHYREALRISKIIGDREGIAIRTGNLAVLALKRKDWPSAEALAREALTLSEKVGRQELIGTYNLYLAQALTRQGRKSEDYPHARRAVEIFTALRHPELELAQQTLAECDS